MVYVMAYRLDHAPFARVFTSLFFARNYSLKQGWDKKKAPGKVFKSELAEHGTWVSTHVLKMLK
jgi:hypothetical protein